MSPLRCGTRRRRGFVLLAVLVALVLAALGAAEVGQRRADERRRMAEEELLFVGEQFRAAIESYWRQSPGRVRALPTRLSDLLQDPRFPQARRHLRKVFLDPLAPGQAWGLVRQGEAIVGVYSRAEGSPFRRSGFTDIQAQAGFETAGSYADWRFTARLPGPATPSPFTTKRP